MNRNLLLLWVADSTSLFGTAIYTLALTLLSVSLTESALGAGAVLFTSSIPYLVLGLIGGVLADRYNRKWLMILCDVARGLLVLTLPIALALGWEITAVHVAIIGFLVTSFRTVFFPANNASIPDLITDKAKLSQVNGYFQLTRNLALVLGPGLAGWLMLLDLNVVQLLYIDSASYVLSAIAIGMIRFPAARPPAGKRPNLLLEAWHGVRPLFQKQRDIGLLLLIFAVQVLVGTGLMGVAVPRILTSLPKGQSVYGALTTVTALAAAASAMVMIHIKMKQHDRWMFAGYLLRGFSFLLMALLPSVELIFVAAAVVGFSYSLSSIPLTTLLQVHTPTEDMGKVVAIRSTLGNLADSFGYVTIGGLISWFGHGSGFAAGATLSLVASVAGILLLRITRAQAETTGQSA